MINVKFSLYLRLAILLSNTSQSVNVVVIKFTLW